MVWNDPNGTWAIKHVNRNLLGDIAKIGKWYA
jgi:hypothetical protein